MLSKILNDELILSEIRTRTRRRLFVVAEATADVLQRSYRASFAKSSRQFDFYLALLSVEIQILDVD